MGHTDNCDIYASLHEDAFNRVISHIRRQRPSLFNYATPQVAANLALLCQEIGAHPVVELSNNPQVTIVDPLPIPGSNFTLNFALQLVELKIDFHPGNQFNLPAELRPPLGDQKMAIMIELCGGIGCPPKEIMGILDNMIPPPRSPESSYMPMTHIPDKSQPSRPPITVPTNKLTCFCLEAFVVGDFKIKAYNGKQYLEPYLGGLEIVDIKPEGLESSIECYIGLMLKLVALPGLRMALKALPLNLTQGAEDLFTAPVNISIGAMPVSATLPNNPAIEQDQLKAFVKVEVN